MVVSKANRVAGRVLATLLLLTFAAGAYAADAWQVRVTNISDRDTITSSVRPASSSGSSSMA